MQKGCPEGQGAKTERQVMMLGGQELGGLEELESWREGLRVGLGAKEETQRDSVRRQKGLLASPALKWQCA